MTEQLSDDTLDDFQRITSYDIRDFFAKYVAFSEEDYPSIVNFYSGVTNVVPTSSIDLLKYLNVEYKKIIDITVLNNQYLDNYQYWVLIEYVEDIGQALETATNVSKWLRSAVTKDGYKRQVVTNLVMEQGQGLEDVERIKIGGVDFQNSWVDTALQNQLTEEDYTLNGGYLIKVTFKNNNALFLNGIIDNIDTPEKVYGLDIKRQLSWQNSDLATLGYADTIEQCAEILTGLKKGDDPSFPNRGINGKTGINVATLSYQVLFRDLASNFATDDSFKSISIKDIRRSQDAIYLDFEIQTKAGDVFSRSTLL